jgi:hypothetical protein
MFNLSVDVANAKPVAPGVTLAPEKPTKATPIYAQPASPSDVDGDMVRLNYSWLVAGNPVQGQTSNALSPTFFAKGQDVTVIVTPNDGIEDGTPALANVNVQNSPPTAPGVTITASPRTTDSIVCSLIAPSSDLDGDTLTYAFTWTKNDQPFNNAVTTGTSSVVAAPHANGDLFSCTASVFDGAAVVASPVMTVTATDCLTSDTYGDGIDSDCDGMDCQAVRVGSRSFALCGPNGGSINRAIPVTWSAARATCQQHGYSDLASVHSAAESDAIYGLLTAAGVQQFASPWIGFNDQAAEGAFVWSDGTAVNYTNWDTPEPNGGRGSNCVHMNPWDYRGPTSRWNDSQCDPPVLGYGNAFVCQK